jgi:hypothetical protein
VPRAPRSRGRLFPKATRVTAHPGSVTVNRSEPFVCYTPGSCRGLYQVDRQPGAAVCTRLRAHNRGSGEPPSGLAVWAGACVAWRWRRRRLDEARARFLSPPHSGAGRSLAPSPAARDRPPTELHPHLHGVSAEDVADPAPAAAVNHTSGWRVLTTPERAPGALAMGGGLGPGTGAGPVPGFRGRLTLRLPTRRHAAFTAPLPSVHADCCPARTAAGTTPTGSPPWPNSFTCPLIAVVLCRTG